MSRYFRATLTDSDGEQHEYNFTASKLWVVTHHIAAKMSLEGDFYGHKADETITLEVAELMPGHEYSGIIPLV